MTAKAQPSRKNNDIEILRAFAILYTIILHLGVLLPAAWTWVIIASVIQLLIIGVTDIQYSLRDISLNTATALGNVMNIYIPYCLANGGGQQCVIDNFLGHYWSLSL